MRSRRLQHVSIPYPAGRQLDVRAFYADLVGLEEITLPATLKDRALVWFSAGPDSLEIHLFPGAVDPESRGHVCLDVADLESVRRRLQEGGYSPYAATPIPNRPRFFCRDPFGNLLEFTSVLGDYAEDDR